VILKEERDAPVVSPRLSGPARRVVVLLDTGDVANATDLERDLGAVGLA